MFDEALDIGLTTRAKAPAIALSDDSQVSDKQLVRAVLDGDDHAFAEIFQRYRKLVTHVVSRFFSDRSQIEECVQQSFVKTYFSLRSFRGGHDNSFPAWVKQISVNVCYDEFRRIERTNQRHLSDLDGDGRQRVETVSDPNADSPECSLAAAQLAEKILSSLGARDRMAMTLVYSQDYSLTEAAEIIGVSTASLKSRLHRCRNHIKTRFSHLFT